MAEGGEVFFRLVFLNFLLIGLYQTYFNHEENKCDMTYMFEHPQYLKIKMSGKTTSSFPRYSLYLYGEGEYFGRIQNMKLDGIPLLYIPGHGGSYKQARSLGSVLLRKSLAHTENIHFNVFTADLNEELSAMYGGVLDDQSNFVKHCIDKILALYSDRPNPPRSVVLVGHSMGGMIARSIVTLPGYDIAKVKVIINLATPNLAPVLDVDHFIHNFYKRVNGFWSENTFLLQKLSVISIGGDSRDYLVPSTYTRLPVNASNMISTVTTSVPKVHVSADHQCIVWCKQLVLTTSRFLYDIVDSDTKQISSDDGLRSRALQFHFLQNSGASNAQLSDKSEIEFAQPYEWREIVERGWTLRREKTDGAGVYFAFRISNFMDTPNLIVKTDTNREKWVFGCSGTEKCDTGLDLSEFTILAKSGKLKILHLNLEKIAEGGFTHLVFPVSKGRMNGMLDVNILSDDEMTFEVPTPHIFSNLWTFNKGYSYNFPPRSRNTPNRFYYAVTMKEFSSVYQALDVSLDKEVHLLRSEVPWDPHYTSMSDKSSSIALKLRFMADERDDPVVLHVYSQRNAKLTLNVRIYFMEFTAQLFRTFSNMIPMMIVANILLVYTYQLKEMNEDKSCHDFFEVHSTSAKPFKLQPVMVLAKPVFGMQVFSSLWYGLGLPKPDFMVIESEYRVWFTLVTIIIFQFSFEIIRFIMTLQTVIMYVVRHMMGYFTPPSNSSITARCVVHGVILAVLLQYSSDSAVFTYIYLVSFFYCADLRNQVVPLPKKQKEDSTEEKDQYDVDNDAVAATSDEEDSDNGTDDEYELQQQKAVTSEDPATTVPSSDASDKAHDDDDDIHSQDGDEAVGTSSKEISTVDKKETDSDSDKEDDSSLIESKEEADEPSDQVQKPQFPKEKELDPTSPSEDRYSVFFAQLQLWLCLLFFSIPTSIVKYQNFREDSGLPGNPMRPHTLVAAGLFLLQTLSTTHDGFKRSCLKPAIRFKFPAILLMALICCTSMYRIPYFIIGFLAFQIVSQLI